MTTFLEIEPEYSSYDTSGFIIIPVPHEATTSYGKGTKNGPKAILEASQIVEDYDIELGTEPYKISGIHVAKPVDVSKDPHGNICAAVKKVLADGKVPVLLGGEHSISYGAVKAAKQKFRDLSVLQFDAHADLRERYHGTKQSHACVMRRVRELCPAVQVGIRSQDIEETEYIKKNGLAGSIFYAEKYDSTAIPFIVDKLTQDVYITFDVDAFDPSIMPATGTPEPGGLGWYQVLDILRAVIAKKNIVGIDVTELSPRKNMEFCDYTVAKLIYKMIGYINLKS